MAKYKVLYDIEDFKVKTNEGGLYSILPYERLDKNKKALFKVGFATNFDKRFENYHTSYPLGFYYKNLLASPIKGKEEFRAQVEKEFQKQHDGHRPTPDERPALRKKVETRFYKQIENYIFHKIEDKGGKRLKTTTRIRNADEEGGQSEWFYTNEKVLDNAFKCAQKEYGGRNMEKSLDHINFEADKNKKKSTYTGEIHYKIY